MKRLFIILSLLAGMCITTYANNGGGLFQRGKTHEKETSETVYNRGGFPGFPGHGEEDDQDAPIGSGAALLVGFGAAYAVYKRNRK